MTTTKTTIDSTRRFGAILHDQPLAFRQKRLLAVETIADSPQGFGEDRKMMDHLVVDLTVFPQQLSSVRHLVGIKKQSSMQIVNEQL
jgi:hypothetical protein